MTETFVYDRVWQLNIHNGEKNRFDFVIIKPLYRNTPDRSSDLAQSVGAFRLRVPRRISHGRGKRLRRHAVWVAASEMTG